MQKVRFLACLLVLMLALGMLAACGDGETSGAESGFVTEGASVESGAAEGEESPEPSEEENYERIAFQMPAKAVGYVDGNYTIEMTYEGNTLTVYSAYSRGDFEKVIECASDGRLLSQKTYVGGALILAVAYDEEGRSVSYIQYNEDGSVYRSTQTEYGANGDMAKQVEVERGDTTTREYTYEREYDESGNVTKYIQYINGKVRKHYEYAYENGNLAKMISYRSDGSGFSSYDYEYEYDAAGNMSKEICYREDGSVDSEFEYAADGHMTKSVSYNYDGSVYYACEYNEYGLVVKRVSPRHGKMYYDDDFEVTEYCTVMLTEEQAKMFWKCIGDLDYYGEE